jgi:hypothetical protein
MADEEERVGKIKQFRMAFTATRELDRRLVPYMIGIGVGVALVLLAVAGLVFGRWIIGSVVAVLFGVYAALLLFGRRAQKAQFVAIEGKGGAAAAVLEAMRGPWRVTPAVAFTRKQDLVHRVVGRPGVVLVGEGEARLLVRRESLDDVLSHDVPLDATSL